MRSLLYTIIVAAALPLLSACNPQPEAPALLAEARRLAEGNPGGAMRLIDSISYPDKSLNREQYMNYWVTRVQVYYKNYRDITADTLVFDAARFFARKGKAPGQAALAHFYSGCVRREQSRFEPAMQYYKDAERYAEKAKDGNLQGLIQYNTGDLLNAQGLYEKATASYKKAARLYRGLPGKQAHALSAAGRMFLLEGNPDSAFYYFHQGMEEAGRTGDNALQSLLAQNLGVAYREAGKYGEAEKYLRQSLKLNSDSAELPRYWLNFAKLYSRTQQKDSADMYIKRLKTKLEGLPDYYFRSSALNYLAGQESAQGNCEAAFFYKNENEKVLRLIMDENLKQSVYEIQQKYDFAQEKILHQQQLNRRQHWIILLLVALIIGGTVFTWHWIRQRNRQAEVQRNVDTLQETNRELESAMRQQQLDLRKDLLLGFDVARKAMKLNQEMTRPEKTATGGGSLWMEGFNKVVHGDESVEDAWDALSRVFNTMRPGLAGKIRENYPRLTEAEFRICILTYAGFRIKEISVVLHQSDNTIQTRRTHIRRKMGLGPGGDIAAHIDRLPG